MKLTVIPNNSLYPTEITIGVDDFKYGEDAFEFCKRLEVVLNELMNDKGKRK